MYLVREGKKKERVALCIPGKRYLVFIVLVARNSYFMQRTRTPFPSFLFLPRCAAIFLYGFLVFVYLKVCDIAHLQRDNARGVSVLYFDATKS